MFKYAFVLLILYSLSLTCRAEEEKPGLRPVRVIYLVPSDLEERAAYKAAIHAAILDLQKWYGKQLKGPTFRLNDPIVEVAKSEQTAAWFYDHPAGPRGDDWGFNNSLAEAKRLFGARHNDPNFIWVIYVDCPGNKGRGGSGVTCLPGDDLLGLVGEHPTQKNKLRWVAGLGHELGHAFGLLHPTDTVKDADAIMWAGIYGKFPVVAYLTPQDKAILLQSPFFYHDDDRPVVAPARVVARYAYGGGAFEQLDSKDPIRWREVKTDSDARYAFEEARRDAETIVLRDPARDMAFRFPLKGGRSELSEDGGKTWRPFYLLGAPQKP
jgi:hypothetical protein